MPSTTTQPVPPQDRDTTIRTFLIADVRGYTHFTRERGDEAAARMAAKFAQIAAEGVEAFDGDLVETRGDEVLAVFGSPRRALRAGVELQDAFAHEAALDPSLPLRVGIGLAAGEAVRVGNGFRGNALNMAARLCARADAGVVLATEELVGLAGPIDGIAYEPTPPLDLKGVEGAVRPVRISFRAAAEPAKREEPPAGQVPDLPPELDAASPILGREHELRVLRWFWRRARHGHGRAVFVHGPSGAGKTRLAAELARVARAERALVLYAACAGPAERALTQLADAATSKRPTLVVADDLDSAGGTVLDTVGALLESLATRPLLVLGTYRSDASPHVSNLLDRADPLRESRLALEKVEPGRTGTTSSQRRPIAAGWRKLPIALAAAGAIALAVAILFLASGTNSDDNPSPRSASDINAEILGPVLASDRALTNRILSLTGTRASLRRNRPRIRASAAALFSAVRKAQTAGASAPLPPGNERSRQLFQLALSDHLVHARATQRAAQDLPTYYDVWAVVYTADDVARSYEDLRRAAPTLKHPVRTARAAKRLLDVSAPFPVRPEQGVLWRPAGYSLDPAYARRYARRVNAFGLRRLRRELLTVAVDFQNERIPFEEGSRRIRQLIGRLTLIKLEAVLTPEPRLLAGGTTPGPAVLPSAALGKFVGALLTQALAAQSWMIATHSGDPEAGSYHSAYLEAGSRASKLEDAFFRDFERLRPTE
jgi:class 3 adenylate cyclase